MTESIPAKALQHEKQICKESQPYIQKAYDAGNKSAAIKRSLHSVGATTDGERAIIDYTHRRGERGPKGVDARGSGKEATASDENSLSYSLSNSLCHNKSCNLYLFDRIVSHDTYFCTRELLLASLDLFDHLGWV